LEMSINLKPSIITLGEYDWTNKSNLKIKNIQRKSIRMGELAASELIKNINKGQFYEEKYTKVKNTIAEDFKLQPETIGNKIKKTREVIKILILKNLGMESLKLLLPNFTELNNIDIEFEVTTSYDYIHDVAYRKNNKDNFDILYIDNTWMSELAESGYLIELDDYVFKNGEGINNFQDNILEVYSEYKGKNYGFPFDFDIQIMIYRKDLFEDTNIRSRFFNEYRTELKPPKTWEEFNIISRFFTKSFNPKSPTLYGTSFGANYSSNLICDFLSRFYGYNGTSFDFLKDNIDRKIAIKALNNYKEGFKYATPKSLNQYIFDQGEDLLNGRVALINSFLGAINNIFSGRQDIIDRIDFEIVPGGNPILGGWSIGINSESKKINDSYKFIKWISDISIALPYNILGGNIPLAEFFENSLFLKRFPWLLKTFESFKLCRRRISNQRESGETIPFNVYENIYSEIILKTIKGEIESEKVIEFAKRKFDRTLQLI
jgi:multiple sugar transport system substrate-binding protein